MTMILSAVVILAMCWALVKSTRPDWYFIAGGLDSRLHGRRPACPLVSFFEVDEAANVFEVIIASMGFAAVVKMTGLHTH